MSTDGKNPSDASRGSAVDELMFASTDTGQQPSRQPSAPQKVFQPTAGMSGFRRASTVTGVAASGTSSLTSRTNTSVRASIPAAAPQPVTRALPSAPPQRTAAPAVAAQPVSPSVPPAAVRQVPLNQGVTQQSTQNTVTPTPGGEDSPLRRVAAQAPGRGVLPAPVRKRFVAEGAGNVQTASPVQSATEAGRSIVDSARIEADRIVREAKRYIEGERQAARELGAEQGKRDSAELILYAHALRHEILEGAKAHALDLIFDISREVIQHEVTKDRASILPRIEKAMERLLSAKLITLAVHPEDVQLVREHIDTLVSQVGLSHRPNIVSSDTLTPGSARLETETTVVEASIETHLDAIRGYIERVIARNIADEEEELNGPAH